MNEQEKNEMTSLSNTVTKLCEAIDPSFTKGPETDKLVAYAVKTRMLAESLASACYGSNRHHQQQLAGEVMRHIEGSRLYAPIVGGDVTKD